MTEQVFDRDAFEKRAEAGAKAWQESGLCWPLRVDELRQSYNAGIRDFHGANLAGANLADANLADANLAGANLAGANLADAYFARANLADANLAGANLADANLAGANLADAYFARANLARANLARANLADANLARANLARANLAGANLADAYFAGANLADANLARANLADANLADANLAGANLADAYFAGARHLFAFGPIGSRGDLLYAVSYTDGLRLKAGCFWGTLAEFKARNDARADAQHREDYQALYGFLDYLETREVKATSESPVGALAVETAEKDRT